DELRRLARRTIQVLEKALPAGSVLDMNIEQEGPQPQLIISPDRTLCARYNVRIEDVTKLINIAVGGDPVGMLYDGERRFDIGTRFGRRALPSPQAIGQLPVFAADGTPVPLAQVAVIQLADGPTLIARENNRPRLTVRCDIAGDDHLGFVRKAQQAFD